MDDDFLVVDSEQIVHLFFVHLRGDQGDERDQDEADDHRDGTGVDGRRDVVEEHVHNGEQDAPGKGDPHGELRDVLRVQAVHERCEEGTGEAAPGDTHHLGDECRRVERQSDGDDDEDGDQHTHDGELGLLAHILPEGLLQEVEGHRGAGGQDQRGQGRHGGGQDEDDDDTDEDIGQRRQHGRDDGVEGDGAVLVVDAGYIAEESAEAAKEVAAAGDDKSEEGRDDRTGLDGLLILDGIELLDHLRETPGTEGRQDDDTEECERVRAEEAREKALRALQSGFRDVRRVDDGEFLHSVQEAALAVQDRRDDSADAEEHDDALNEVVERRGHVTAGNDVDRGQERHDDNDDVVVDAEGHSEETGQTVVDTGGVRDQEDERDDGAHHLKRLGTVPLAEVLGHGAGIELLGHDSSASAKDDPREQRTDKGVPQTDPGGRKAELPAELAGVTDEHDGREVRRTEGEGGEPGTDGPSAEDVVIDVGRMSSRPEADEDHDTKENDQKNDLDCQNDFLQTFTKFSL